MRMTPRIFFGLASPIICFSIGSMLFAFLFIKQGALSVTGAFILLSLALVIPDYQEKYCFYFWSSVAHPKYFGFIYGLYSCLKNVFHIGTSLMLKYMVPTLTTGSVTFAGLLLICIFLLGFASLYGTWFTYKKKDFFFKQDQLNNRQQRHASIFDLFK